MASSLPSAAQAAAGALDAWSALVAVYQSVLHDVVQMLEQDAGMDSGVFSALAYLARAETKGRMRMSELQQCMHPRYSQPGCSRLVQRMEADGLLERRRDPTDGRASLVVLTPAGRARYRAANLVYSAAVEDAFGKHLRPEDGAQLERALRELAARRDAGAPADAATA